MLRALSTTWRQVHADHVPQIPQARPLRVGRDGRRWRAGLGLAHGAQSHGAALLLRGGVRSRRHTIRGRSVHVALRRRHHRVLQPSHLVPVHLLDLRAVHAVVLMRISQLVLHERVRAVRPAVHVRVSIHALTHRHRGVHGAGAWSQKPTW